MTPKKNRKCYLAIVLAMVSVGAGCGADSHRELGCEESEWCGAGPERPSGGDAGGGAGDAGAGAGAGAAADAGAGAGADAGAGIRNQWIGGACDSAASCNYPGAVCLTNGFPLGLCSQTCTRLCPDRAGQPVTFCIDTDTASGTCVAKCTNDRDCRPGYRCGARGRYNEPTTLGSVCVPPDTRPAASPTSPSPFPARISTVRANHDSTKLEQAFTLDGVVVPANAKIAVLKIRSIAGVPSYEYFDFKGTLFDDAFWPASTIKLFAAVGALELLEDKGHSALANIEYAAGYDGGFRTILNAALIVSDNVAYDRLMLLAGFDEMNTGLLAPERGFERTVIQRRYGSSGSLRDSPRITLDEGGRTTTIPARHGSGTYNCAREGNCTNPYELGDAIRRVGMHERLGDGERFRISRDDLAYLRVALSTNRGQSIFSAAESVFGAGNAVIMKKAGLAGGWRLDNAFLRDAATGEEYVVTIALPDATPIPAFYNITRSALIAARAGRLSTTPVAP